MAKAKIDAKVLSPRSKPPRMTDREKDKDDDKFKKVRVKERVKSGSFVMRSSSQGKFMQVTDSHAELTNKIKSDLENRDRRPTSPKIKDKKDKQERGFN